MTPNKINSTSGSNFQRGGHVVDDLHCSQNADRLMWCHDTYISVCVRASYEEAQFSPSRSHTCRRAIDFVCIPTKEYVQRSVGGAHQDKKGSVSVWLLPSPRSLGSEPRRFHHLRQPPQQRASLHNKEPAPSLGKECSIHPQDRAGWNRTHLLVFEKLDTKMSLYEKERTCTSSSASSSDGAHTLAVFNGLRGGR